MCGMISLVRIKGTDLKHPGAKERFCLLALNNMLIMLSSFIDFTLNSFFYFIPDCIACNFNTVKKKNSFFHFPPFFYYARPFF